MDREDLLPRNRDDVAVSVRRWTEAWSRFWFGPTETSTLALVRAAFGVVVFVWGLSLLPVLAPLLGPHGVVPRQPDGLGAGAWSVFDLSDGGFLVGVVMVGLFAGSLALVAGFHGRIAAVVVFVSLLALQRRNPFAFNSGDLLLRTTAFYLMLAPAVRAFSVESWPRRAPWPLRLIQIQLTIVYLSSVWAKVRGTRWNDGTATSYVLRLDDLTRFPVPRSVATSELLANLMTYGTLAIEAAVGILIWNRALRPYVVAAGLGLHLTIDYSIRVGFFGPALLVSYLAFLPPERATRILLAVKPGLSPGRSRRPQ
jgi:hypothetical protein